VTAGPLEALALTAEDLARPPLEFTRQVMGAFADHVVGAFSAPLPVDDPMSAYRYVRARRQSLIDSAKQPALVRLQDKNLSQLAPIGQAQSVRFEEIAADTGEAGVVLRGGDYLSKWVRSAVRLEEDLHLSLDPIPTKPDWKTRWGGKITSINAKRDAKGFHTVELIASANREHFKNILIAATPFFPPEVQPIRMWMLPANIRTACTITMAIQLARHFFPLASVPSNILNPFGWVNPFGPDAVLGFDPLSWPIQPQFINFALDQSRTSLLTSVWNNFHDATKDPLKDAGATGRVYTWFTEDETSPHPELEKIVGKDLAKLARPHRNCLIAAFEDKSGYEGPTGTAADGPINLFASTLDDLITTTVFPVDTDNDGEIDPIFRRLFLVAPPKPDVVFYDGQHSGIVDSAYHQIKGPVKTTMTGGKSPKLVNDLQTFGIRYGISQIAQVISGGPPGGAYELPAVEGLDNLYQGQLDNILFAWQRYTNPFRALFTGDMGYLEHVERPGSTAWTVSGVLNLRIGDHKKRPYRWFKTTIRNAHPWMVYTDFNLADRLMFEIDGIFYVDQASAIRYQYDRNTPVTYELSVGDNTREDDPFAEGVRAIQAVFSIVSMVTGEGWLF
jgi:hypothetical protein